MARNRPRSSWVPPLYERDLRLRTRMAHPSYDFLFGKPALRFLFEDYMQPSAHAWLNFRPAEDPRVSVSAVLDAELDSQAPRRGIGAVNLRYQPDPEDYLNFFDIKAAAQEGGFARARACLFDPKSGLGGWASVPLIKGGDAAKLDATAQFGLRYSSPTLSSGVVFSPVTQKLEQLWLATQHSSLSAGVISSPMRSVAGLKDASDLQQLANACCDRLSYTVAYTLNPKAPGAATPPGRGSFTAAVEVREQRQMVVSFLYHMALQRNVKNPFENGDVIAITNYLDVGLEVATDYSSSNGDTAPGNQAALGIAWQANKSVLVKGKVGTDSAAAAVALKSWSHPSWVAAVSANWLYGSNKPKLGFTFGTENHGNIRYERSKDQSPRGSAVVQRHVAQTNEIDNAEGTGLLVPVELEDDPGILGQTPRPSDRFL